MTDRLDRAHEAGLKAACGLDNSRNHWTRAYLRAAVLDLIEDMRCAPALDDGGPSYSEGYREAIASLRWRVGAARIGATEGEG